MTTNTGGIAIPETPRRGRRRADPDPVRAARYALRSWWLTFSYHVLADVRAVRSFARRLFMDDQP